MEQCEFCDEEFEDEIDLHVHWGEEHEDELNSHQQDKVKKAERKSKEREKKERERKKNLAFKVLGTGLAIVLAAVLIPQMLNSVSDGGGNGNGAAQAANFSLESEPMLGQESANVTIVEFGDFYCPACKSFTATVKPRLESNYIETGKANFYFMNFPLNNHEPQASRAAIASECVYNQNETQFWNYHDGLFENQRQMSYDLSGLMDLARTTTEGLDYDQLESCISSQETSEEVNQDFQKGLESGVSGTPTVYVNGRQAPNFGYSTISAMIEDELGN